MKPLFVITARGGSKGLPGKNTKILNGKPLITYSIEIARNFTGDSDICVSTDDDAIINVVEACGLHIPFKRPAELATDSANSQDVLVHAWNFYKNKGLFYDCLVLLQPTSPFRKKEDLKNCLDMYSGDCDMVVSVKESDANPYFNLFEDTGNGFLIKSKEANFKRRQDCPKVYMLNGSVYVINPHSLLTEGMSGFRKVKKYIMDENHSVDIDTQKDWDFAEYLIKNNRILI